MTDLIEAYLGHLRLSKYSPETVRERGYVLRRADRELPYGVEAASTAEVEQWLGVQRLCAWSFSTYWQDLYGFYAWTVGRGWLDWNPMADLPRPRVSPSEPRPATEEQLAVALGLPPPWRTAVVLAAFCGLRCAEIARLSRDDVTAETLYVARKGGRIQLLPMHPLAWAAVQDLPPGGPAVPRSRRGGHFVPKGLSTAVSRRLAAAGLVGMTLHRFRHRFATIALLPAELGGSGADIRTVQELLGHASVASTQVYTQVTDRQRRTAVLALPVPSGPLLQEAA